MYIAAIANASCNSHYVAWTVFPLVPRHKTAANADVMCKNMSEEIKKYAVVKVVALNPLVPEAEVGDEGAVLMIFGENTNPEAFEIESVNKDGTNKWLGTFFPNQVKLVKNV